MLQPVNEIGWVAQGMDAEAFVFIVAHVVSANGSFACDAVVLAASVCLGCVDSTAYMALTKFILQYNFVHANLVSHLMLSNKGSHGVVEFCFRKPLEKTLATCAYGTRSGR